MDYHSEIQTQLVSTGKFMFENQLAWGTAGNISARVNENEYYISASGTKLGQMKESDFVLYPTDKDLVKPSKETPMHDVVYTERPEIGAVLHASPFYSTLLACSDVEIASNFFVETMYYLEKVERVRYEHPGSIDLAEAVREKTKLANVLLLENHGVLVYDTNLSEALTSLQTLEFAAKMIVLTMGNKLSIKGLPKEIEGDFLNSSGYKKRRVWPIE